MEAPESGVTPLELFFDLVFVFAVTQLTEALLDDLTGRGLLGVVLILLLVWWMYSGYAWLTNAVPPQRLSLQLPLLAGMAAFLVLSLTVPHAFRGGEDGETGAAVGFALAYLAVVVVHLWLYTRATGATDRAAILRVGAVNLVAPVLLLVGAVAGGTWQYVLWALAAALCWITPYLLGLDGFAVRAGHFVERHGLVVLIALGESVVDVGVGAEDEPVGLTLVVVAVLGLALSAGLWWLYFGGTQDEQAVAVLEAAEAARRPMVGVRAWGYAHVPILLGVVCAAAGIRLTLQDAGSPATAAQALALGGGVALYLLGDVGYRLLLGIRPVRWRATAVVLALASTAVGRWWSSGAQLAVLVAVLVAVAVAEHAQGPRVCEPATA